MGDGEEGGVGPRREEILSDLREGLAGNPKELPPKYFYDERGSELFEAITRLPEYYPTAAEREILAERIPPWISELRPGSLVELGAGNADKTRTILDALVRERSGPTYVPLDVSGDFLRATARTLREEYPDLSVEPVVADFSRELPLPEDLPRPTVIALLGSTIGNFSRDASLRLLERIRRRLRARDRVLMGFDLRAGSGKPASEIVAAYDDARGVTAAFNLNVLRVLNREAGSDFDPEDFAHRAVYDEDRHRIEMHLVALRDHRVEIPGLGSVDFREGEPIRTEISRKYDRERVEAIMASAGLAIDRWWLDSRGRYALAVGLRRPPGGGINDRGSPVGR